MGRIKKTITVNAPIEECYKSWIDFEKYPKIIDNLISLERTGDPNVWQWRIKGPEGEPLECTIHIDALKHNNQVISWHTIRKGDIVHEGAITMAAGEKAQTTRINFVMDYTIPTGLQEKLGTDCAQRLEDTVSNSLEKFKKHVESVMAEASGSKGKF